MSPEKQRRRGRKTKVIEQLPHLDADNSDYDPMEKDEVEEELEKLVFGDDEGFRRELNLEGHRGLEEVPEVDDEQQREDLLKDGKIDESLEGIDDADVRKGLYSRLRGLQADDTL